MSHINAWSRHYQSVWLERAGDPELPDWLRVAALAYGSHRANGHATFKRGHVALILADVDTDSGALTPRSRQGIYRAIRTAVRHGWLLDGSTARCLVVPGHAITGGLGSPADECPQHAREVTA